MTPSTRRSNARALALGAMRCAGAPVRAALGAIPALAAFASLAPACFPPSAHAQPCVPQWEGGFSRFEPDGQINSFVVFDDGAGDGPCLFAGGVFTQILHNPPPNIASPGVAKWTGTEWKAVGAGLSGAVNQLLVWDDGQGAGPRLHAVGFLVLSGAPAAVPLAAWDGAQWTPAAPGAGYATKAVLWNDGQREAVYCVGWVNPDGPPGAVSPIFRWDGLELSDVSGAIIQGGVTQITARQGGPLHGLYIFGTFNRIGTDYIFFNAKWDGQTWRSMAPYPGSVHPAPTSLEWFDAGDGLRLYVRGARQIGPNFVGEMARWDGVHWEAFDDGLPLGRIFEFDFGEGPRLAISADDGLYAWDGQSVEPVGPRINAPAALAVFRADGGVPRLFAGGDTLLSHSPVPSFHPKFVAQLDEDRWRRLDNGLHERFHALRAWTPPGGSPTLIAADGPSSYTFSPARSRFWRLREGTWDPFLEFPEPNRWVRDFRQVEAGVFSPSPQLFVALGCDPSGPAFSNYAAGLHNGIASWDGASWDSLNGGLLTSTGRAANVVRLLVHDDGAGMRLYAAGDFASAGGTAAQHIARWDGSTWSPVGLGPGGTVADLIVHDDGAGPALWAAGQFPRLGSPGLSFAGVAKWDGTGWTPFAVISSPHSFFERAEAIGVFDTGDRRDLVVYIAQPYGGVFLWNGAAWTHLAVPGGSNVRGVVTRFFSRPPDAENPGSELWAYSRGGLSFGHPLSGAPSRALAVWNGARWALPNTTPPAPNHWTRDAELFDDGAGPRLWVGGAYEQSNGEPRFISILRSCPTSCAGDISGDGLVNMQDLNILLTTYGQTSASGSNAPILDGDLDFSGRVDFHDLNRLLTLFGSACP